MNKITSGSMCATAAKKGFNRPRDAKDTPITLKTMLPYMFYLAISKAPSSD